VRRRASTAGLLAVATALSLAAACSGSDGGGGSDDAGEISAEVASFDLSAGREERFTVGFFSQDNRVLAYGDVQLSFAFLGTGAETQDPTQAALGPPVEATFLPVAGQDVDANRDGPRLVNPSEARGVYGATGVTFDRAGFWVVNAEGNADGEPFSAGGGFEVKAAPQVVAASEPAPRTENPLAGDSTAAPESIDSRAGDAGGEIPDPDLHSTTIADALAAGRPVVVVVSTPVFCVSRFCGPITDEVERLAQEFGDRVDFVHLEVWQDFENQAVNPAAAEWILPRDGGEAREPWVFVVGGDGVVRERFDNVATDADLRRAIEAVAAEG
jgi:hypothetical protein